uniref:Tetraspanin n=1 Tax=Knipowitschia caucasica TaxID=637954 RepID=A0AAV2IXD5_KNICA
MGEINTCLKRTFTIFNIIFAVFGGLIILLAVLAHVLTSIHGADNLENRTLSLIMLYVVGAITMVIAGLGAYGAHKEKKGPLIAMEPVLKEAFSKYLPLDQAPEDVQEMTQAIQSEMQCCGLFSYTDWRDNIPDSCLCHTEFEESECVRVLYKVLMTKKIYAKPCFPILMHYVLLIADIMLAVFFTLGTLALLGMGLSSLMIHQLRPESIL